MSESVPCRDVRPVGLLIVHLLYPNEHTHSHLGKANERRADRRTDTLETPGSTILTVVKSWISTASLAALTLGSAATAPLASPSANAADYLVYVASEAADRISLVRFGPDGGRLDHDLPTGIMPTDIDGPHGLAVSPDRQFYYVSIAHGQPNGSVWKYSAATDAVVGRTTRSGCSRRRCRRARTASCSTSSTSTCTATWCLRRCPSSLPGRCWRSRGFRPARCRTARGSIRRARSTTRRA